MKSRLFLILASSILLVACGEDGGGTRHPDSDGGYSGPDSDGDGLPDSQEMEIGTDPNEADTDGDGLTDGEEVDLGTDPNEVDSDGDGVDDGQEVFLGTDPNVADASCADVSAGADVASRPVDIIVFVDNSSSMDTEIPAVVQRINQDFAAVLDTNEVDYRVILISRHGEVDRNMPGSCDDHGICIQPPLASGTCDPDLAPMMTDDFKHYSVCINSRDGLAKVARSFDASPPMWAGGFVSSQYFDVDEELTSIPGADGASGGWSTFLRPGALRAFLVITDDNSDESSSDFIDWMYSKDSSYFGTMAEPNWVFHSILGMAAKMNADEAWLPSEGLVAGTCSGSGGSGVGPGTDYQELSRASEGLRFPICENSNFNAIFQAIADDVVSGSTVPCTFVPDPLAGAMPNFDRVIVVYEPGVGTTRSLPRVDAVGDCPASTEAYYVVGTEIHLCPNTCAVVEADEAASITVRVACDANCGDGNIDSGEECDDGNLDSDDGCSGACALECGDGVLGATESCDDGNRVSFDGCSASCQVEIG